MRIDVVMSLLLIGTLISDIRMEGRSERETDEQTERGGADADRWHTRPEIKRSTMNPLQALAVIFNILEVSVDHSHWPKCIQIGKLRNKTEVVKQLFHFSFPFIFLLLIFFHPSSW